jgi:hypothetical protein
MDTRVFKIVTNDIPDLAPNALKSQQEESEDKRRNKEAESHQLDHMTAVPLKVLCNEYGLKVSGNKADLKECLREHRFEIPSN